MTGGDRGAIQGNAQEHHLLFKLLALSLPPPPPITLWASNFKNNCKREWAKREFSLLPRSGKADLPLFYPHVRSPVLNYSVVRLNLGVSAIIAILPTPPYRLTPTQTLNLLLSPFSVPQTPFHSINIPQTFECCSLANTCHFAQWGSVF